MKDTVFVNLITGSPNYVYGQKRFISSFHELNLCSIVDIATYGTEGEINSEPHHQNPYAFKVYSIEYLRNLGYEKVFWFDASMNFIRHPQPILDFVSQKGYFFEEAGHYVGNWCNDNALQWFGITREEAMKMIMFSSGMMGLDFTQQVACDFFDKWKESMLAGCFVGSWGDHRHDMTCASIVANQMGLAHEFSKGGTYLAYDGGGYGAPQGSVICLHKGV